MLTASEARKLTDLALEELSIDDLLADVLEEVKAATKECKTGIFEPIGSFDRNISAARKDALRIKLEQLGYNVSFPFLAYTQWVSLSWSKES